MGAILVSEPEHGITERDMRGLSGPEETRAAGGWARSFDGVGHVGVSDMAAVRTELFVKDDAGRLHLRSWCIHCPKDRPTELRLPLEGPAPDPDVESRQISVDIALERGWLSLFALKVAQRMACDPCRERIEQREVAKSAAVATDGRVRDAGIPAGLVKRVSSAGGWDGLIVEGGSADATARRSQTIEVAREWAGKKRPERGLLIWGPVGAGKTHLAAVLALERLRHSPVRWVSVAVLMAELQQAWGDEDRLRALKVLTSTSVAVLDDFDKFAATEGKLTQIFTALDKREQARTPLIVTTNKKPSELKQMMGDVIVSRLLGMCNVLEYPGPDRRLSMGTGS